MLTDDHRAEAADVLLPLLEEARANYQLALAHIVQRAQYIEEVLALLEEVSV